MTKIEFLNRMHQACHEAEETGARFNKDVLYAQAALESNWGNSELAQKANNLFSIKAGNTWNGAKIRLPGPEWSPESGWHTIPIEWRKYLTWTDCVIDYARIIGQLPWYRDALLSLDDPNTFLNAIMPDENGLGWATDPEYRKKIRRIAREIENYGGPQWA